MEVIHVEVRDRSGVLTARVRMGRAPVSLGRAPDNTVEIRDEYADAFHIRAQLQEDGSGVVVADLGTVNGTQIGDRLIKAEQAEVAFDEPVAVGESAITFVSRSTAVPEAKVLQRQAAARSTPYERIPVWHAMGLLLVSMGVAFWLIDYDAIGVFGIVGVAIAMMAIALGWAGLWATGSRVAVGAWHFREHLAFTALWLLVLVPASALLGAVAFVFANPVVDALVDWVLLGVVAWSFVHYGHVDVSSRRSRGYKAMLAGGLMTLTMALVIAVSYVDPTPSEVIRRSLRTVYPVPSGLARTQSVESFLAKAAALEAAHEAALASERDEE